MDKDDVFALVRDVMKISGTILIARDMVSTSEWEALTGGMLLIAPIVWGHLVRRQLKTAIVEAAITGEAKIPGPMAPLKPSEEIKKENGK